jgi:hypothetical protein
MYGLHSAQVKASAPSAGELWLFGARAESGLRATTIYR